MNSEEFRSFCERLSSNIDWKSYSKIISSTSGDAALNKPTGRFDKSEIHSYALEKYSNNNLTYVDMPGVDFISPIGNIKIEDKSSTWMFFNSSKKNKKPSIKKYIHVQMKNTRNGSNIECSQDYMNSIPWDILMLRQTCDDHAKHHVALIRKEDVSLGEIKITKDQIQLNINSSKLTFIYNGDDCKNMKNPSEGFNRYKRDAIFKYMEDVLSVV